MPTDKERMQILEMIDSGAISAEDGLRLLGAIDGPEGPALPESPAPEDYFEIPAAAPVEVPPVPPVPFIPPAPPIPPAPVAPVLPAEPALSAVVSEGRSSGEWSGSAGGERTSAEDTGERLPPHADTIPSDVERWKRWWMIPFWVGVGVTVFGALLMFLAWQAWQFSFWFACTWMPFLLGVMLIVLALASSRMRWLHLRVSKPGGAGMRKVNISMPLPIRIIGWIMKVVGSRVPEVREKGIDQMVMVLEATSADQPFYVEVNDDDGDHVEIYIG